MKFRTLFVVMLVLVASVATFGQAKKPISKQGLVNAVKINGIHYTETRKAARNALVFIHGWTCNSEFWKESINAFPQYKVIAIDLPGHGLSDKPRVNYSMEYFAKAIDTVMRNAKVEKAVLVGHSMGTPIARQFYRLYPEKTLGIVIVDGALKSFFPKAFADSLVAQFRADYKTTSSKFVDGMLAVVKDERLRNEIRASMASTPDYVAISAMEGMADESIWTDDKITVPVLAVMAPSPFWPKDVKEIFTSIAPDIDFQMWSDVSHFLHMEKPKEFNDAVAAFVARKRLL